MMHANDRQARMVATIDALIAATVPCGFVDLAMTFAEVAERIARKADATDRAAVARELARMARRLDPAAVH